MVIFNSTEFCGMTARSFTGRCFCGAVRFRFGQPPVRTSACWCRDYQYPSAGNASINAVFATQGFERTGEVSTYVSTADSGSTMRRSFCPKCGTPLFSESTERLDLMVVRAGALDDPEISSGALHMDGVGAELGYVDTSLPCNERQPP